MPTITAVPSILLGWSLSLSIPAKSTFYTVVEDSFWGARAYERGLLIDAESVLSLVCLKTSTGQHHSGPLRIMARKNHGATKSPTITVDSSEQLFEGGRKLSFGYAGWYCVEPNLTYQAGDLLSFALVNDADISSAEVVDLHVELKSESRWWEKHVQRLVGRNPL